MRKWLVLFLFSIFSAIFCAAAMAHDLHRWNEVEGGIWSPSHFLVVLMDSQIDALILATATKENKTTPPLDRYTFQYQGQQTGAQKIIKIHAYCHAPQDFNPRHHWHVVADGGSCFFEALFDASSHSFSQFRFHGEG